MEVPFTDTLALLLESVRETGALNATGSEVLGKVAARHLRNLHDVNAYVDAHPEVRDRALAAPVVVTGMPRTGTTLLHNLLALDPAHRVLRFWEALRPVPPGPDGPTAEALHAQAERWLDGFHRLVPEFRAVHAATAAGPEECDALLQNTFASQHFDDMFDAGRYSAWLRRASLAAEYRHYALQLRVLSVASPPGTTWALKSPGHLGHLDALLAALPGCTVVLCHRDPRQAVASYASLMHILRRAYSDAAPVSVVGRQALARTAAAMDRALVVRDSVDDGEFVDVSYRQLVADPVGVLRAVYARLDRPWAAEVESRIRRWTVANPQHAHGPHRYDLARFGLTGAEVDAAFAPYLERFGPLAG